MENTQKLSALAENIKSSLKKTNEIVTQKRKTNNRLLITGITSSAASTLVAGITSAAGPLVGTGIEGWRIACIIAAIFGFISTITTGIGLQMKDSSRLSQGTECIGKLKSLDVALITGSKSWEEIVSDFENLAAVYPDFIS